MIFMRHAIVSMPSWSSVEPVPVELPESLFFTPLNIDESRIYAAHKA